MSLELLPQPRELERHEGEVHIGVARRERHEPSLPAEAYTLSIAADGVDLAYRDEAGQRYAHATLAQIETQHAGVLPCLRIRDWPDFPVRGYMLDISRDRVPTRATLGRIVDLLSVFRINHLELYTEHTFAYSGHEAVWGGASPLTPDDVLWLDSVCALRGIELCPNQNCFGHMGRWLAHPEYRHLAEARDGWDTRFGQHLPAGVLAPDEDSLTFVRGLLAELLPCFSSRRINIGCDETFELGRGRSRARVEEHGRGRVYVEFLKRLLEALHTDGREVLFWGDILRHHGELVAELPTKDTVALAWHYEAPAQGEADPDLLERFREFGASADMLKGFSTQVPAFAEHGFPHWVCPGTSSWNSLVGRWPNARGNLLDAAAVGRQSGAGGVLITDWGDNGHLQPPCVSWLPLAYGAAVAWCRETNADLDMAPLLDRFVFADSAGQIGAALEELGALYAGTGLSAMNASPLHSELLGGSILPMWGSASASGVEQVLGALDTAAERVARAQLTCPDAGAVKTELLQAIRLARHGAWRVARSAGLSCPSDDELRSDLSEAIAGQRSAWLLRSRPGGLDDSVGRLEKTLARYEI